MQECDDGPCCLINRKVISFDLQEVGHIVASGEESFIISRGSDNHYRIPKSRLERFRGNDVLLDFRPNDLLLVKLYRIRLGISGMKNNKDEKYDNK